MTELMTHAAGLGQSHTGDLMLGGAPEVDGGFQALLDTRHPMPPSADGVAPG